MAEARELHVILRRQLGLEVARLVVNQMHPDRFPAGSPSEQVLERLLASPPTGDWASWPSTAAPRCAAVASTSATLASSSAT